MAVVGVGLQGACRLTLTWTAKSAHRLLDSGQKEPRMAETIGGVFRRRDQRGSGVLPLGFEQAIADRRAPDDGVVPRDE